MEGHAAAFQGLKDSGVEISPLAQGFIDQYAGEAMSAPMELELFSW